MPEFAELPLIEIKSVSIKLDRGDITRIRLDGNRDIFNHSKVNHELNAGGKLIAIQGIIRYNEADFNFSFGHTIGARGPVMSHIYICKINPSENIELTNGLYSMLSDLYRNTFQS